MSILLILLLLLLPIFNAEPIPNKFDKNDELLMERALAANYLFNLPVRQYQHQLYDSPSDSDDPQQRGKRIYWEHLAFQPADYYKAKIPKRSK